MSTFSEPQVLRTAMKKPHLRIADLLDFPDADDEDDDEVLASHRCIAAAFSRCQG